MILQSKESYDMSSVNIISSEDTQKSMPSPSSLLLASNDAICIFARTGAGSRYLQSLIVEDNKKLCEKIMVAVLSSNNSRMMTNPVACFMVQKLVSLYPMFSSALKSDFIDIIAKDFSSLSLSPYGYHVLLTTFDKIDSMQQDMFVQKLENSVLLFSLIKSKYGSFVAQALLSHLKPRTIISLNNSLLGHSVHLGCHPSATYFVQRFLAKWGHDSNVDFLVEHILRHIRPLVHNEHGTFVVQALLTCRPDFHHIGLLIKWMISNIEAVYKDKPAVQALKCAVNLIKLKAIKEQTSKWINLLSVLTNKLMGTVVRGKPILILAACDEVGHHLLIALLKVFSILDIDVGRFARGMLRSHENVLKANNYGKVVIKLI